MAAAVELEEETLGWHPFAPAAVARRSTPPRAGQPGRPEDPLEARPADLDAFPFGEQLGQVRVVDVDIRRPSEIDDAGPERSVELALRRPAPVAVDEPSRTIAFEGRSQPPQLTLRQPDQAGPLGHRQFTLQDAGQDPGPSLLLRGHRDRRLHSRRLTNSRNSWP